MKAFITGIILCSFPILLPAQSGLVRHGQLMSGKPLCFIENKGQVTDQYGAPRKDIQYCLAAAPGLNIFIGNGAMHYQFSKADTTCVETQNFASLSNTGKMSKLQIANSKSHNTSLSKGEGRGEVSMYRMDVTLENANPNAKVITDDPQPYYENYYTAATKGNTVTASTCGKITYQNIYPHIDWVLYLKDNRLEYDFIVRPGGNIDDIKLHYGGATERLTNNELTSVTPAGAIQESALYAYQAEDRKEIASRFALQDNNVRFNVDNYEGTLIIDPRLVWATYYGGEDDWAADCLADTSGNLYVTGAAGNSGYVATAGAYQTVYEGDGDAFLAKFNGDGAIAWATYYGGTGGNAAGEGVTYDRYGNIFIAGGASCTSGIATAGAYKTHLSGPNNAFVAKFTAAGALLWATYYGGGNGDEGNGITSDTSGAIYMIGQTNSEDSIATPGAYKTYCDCDSLAVFITKFSSTGGLLWGTYFGGSCYNFPAGIAADNTGNIYITGSTCSTDSIATPGAYQSSYGGGPFDAFLAKFTDSGALQWATYYGGSGNDGSVEVDGSSWISSDHAGNIYIAGLTNSTDSIATPGAYQTALQGDGDSYLAKFSDAGAIEWATYFGGNNGAEPMGIAADYAGNVYIVGNTESTDSIATPGAYQDAYSGYPDIFFVKFSGAGSLLFGSYFGAPSEEQSTSITCDNAGNFYFTGETNSPTGIVTPNAYDTIFHAIIGTGGVTFIAKFDSLAASAVNQVTAPNDKVSIYPNPANDLLYITWQGILTPQLQISVINMEGQQLYTASAPSAATHAAIPVSMLPDGMYVCVLQSGVSRYYSKFTVVR